MPEKKITRMSGFLNHCNGAEGTLDSGDLLQIQTRLSGKEGNPDTHPTLETNKQTKLPEFLKKDGEVLPVLVYNNYDQKIKTDSEKKIAIAVVHYYCGWYPFL